MVLIFIMREFHYYWSALSGAGRTYAMGPFNVTGLNDSLKEAIAVLNYYFFRLFPRFVLGVLMPIKTKLLRLDLFSASFIRAVINFIC